MEGLHHASMETAGQSPELTASIFSFFTWHWLQPFVSLGNSKTLEAKDLYDLNPKEETKHCEQLWNHALQKMKQSSTIGTTFSIWKLLWLCFGMEYAKSSLLKPLWLLSAVLRIYILRAIIKALEDKDNLKWWWGVLLILGMFSMTFIGSLSMHMLVLLSQKVGMRARSTVSMAVFNKLLSTKLVSLAETNSGLMLNLVTNDSQKLLDAAFYFHFVWFALIELCTISALAMTEIGVSAIPGVVVAFLTQPLQVVMSRVGACLRVRSVKHTDDRVHLTEEVLTGIRTIKYNGWIARFLHQIASIRRDEVQAIRMAAFVRASVSTLKDFITPLAFLASLGTYLAIHKGKLIPASKAFTVLALFGVIEKIFYIAPLGVQVFGEAIVAVRRLQKLLEIDSHCPENNDFSRAFSNIAVTMMDCSFSWEQNVKPVASSGNVKRRVKFYNKMARTDIETKSAKSVLETSSSVKDFHNDFSEQSLVLKNISISACKGELILIHGPVGSGKSSFLFGILGELQCLKGKSFVLRDIAYVPQQPWILNDTVRQNIVFKYSLDPARYQRTVEACALEHDISQFAGGHDTEIGDKGINLSGGQKARISLARACYSPAPVVLLDDPLAAVDVPTANHLIEHVLNGILKGRTVILVTHNKRVLATCDHSYSMDSGCLQKEEGHEKSNESDASILNGYPIATAISSMLDADNNNAHYQCNKLSDESKDLQSGALVSACNKEKGKSTVKEDMVEGVVKRSTWIAYGKAFGGLLFFFVVIFVFVLGQGVRIMVNYWLGIWTDQKYRLKQDVYLAIYAGLAVGATTLTILKALLFTYASVNAAAKLHNQMAERVLRSPQLFFDQNVAGRILNRFSKDQASVDELLPNTAQTLLENTILGIGNLLFMGVVIPWLLLALPPLLYIFYYFQQRYVVISRELKRLEGVSRSPIYAHFTQTLQGIASVRAYGAQSKMHKIFMSLIDANHRSYILSMHMSRWLAIRLDFATCVFVTLASALVILLRHWLSPGLAGVILVQSMQVTGYIQAAIRLAAETENALTSVERIDAYANLPSEATPLTPPGIIPKDWPSRGEIEFANYTMTYRVDLPPVLNDILFKINAREKVGVLGRTGVGKSSLAAALFRMVENEKCTGDIFIDGINIKLVGLDDLRQRLSIIPQDPALFRGSLRFNLDPFGSYTDTEIYEALSRVHLTKKLQGLDKGLDSLIAQNGENYSIGERQLICLARSLLRRSQVVVMDEATAAVDAETDSLIQATIQTAFHDCTLLSIAHRIETVIHCDRVLVLAAGGHVAEFGSPYHLLTCNNQGLFAEMVKQSGLSLSKKLHEAAYDISQRHNLDALDHEYF